MTSYKSRPGVVLTKLGEEYFLVAIKELMGECPYVTQLNETSAFLWKQMEQGATLEALEAAIGEEYEIDDPAAAHAAIEDIIKQMEEYNYLEILTS